MYVYIIFLNVQNLVKSNTQILDKTNFYFDFICLVTLIKIQKYTKIRDLMDFIIPNICISKRTCTPRSTQLMQKIPSYIFTSATTPPIK